MLLVPPVHNASAEISALDPQHEEQSRVGGEHQQGYARRQQGLVRLYQVGALVEVHACVPAWTVEEAAKEKKLFVLKRQGSQSFTITETAFTVDAGWEDESVQTKP